MLVEEGPAIRQVTSKLLAHVRSLWVNLRQWLVSRAFCTLPEMKERIQKCFLEANQLGVGVRGGAEAAVQCSPAVAGVGTSEAGGATQDRSECVLVKERVRAAREEEVVAGMEPGPLDGAGGLEARKMRRHPVRGSRGKLVLPCMRFGARTTFPPKAAPIAW